MTVTIDIPEFLAADLAIVPAEELKQSALVGLKALAARYANASTQTGHGLEDAAVSSGKNTASADLDGTASGAALLKKLRADGTLTGYGDPNEDSLDVARRLRDSVWQSRDL